MFHCLIILCFNCFIGQIELFSHVPVLKNFVEHLKRKNFNVCVVYLLDSQVCMNKFYLLNLKLNWALILNTSCPMSIYSNQIVLISFWMSVHD